MSQDNYPQLLAAVADHLTQYDLPYTAYGVSGDNSVQVGSRFRCPLTTDSGVLAAWARSMTGVTVEAKYLSRSSTLHAYVDGYLADGYHVRVVAVVTDEGEIDQWRHVNDIPVDETVKVETSTLYDLAEKLEPAAEAVTA